MDGTPFGDREKPLKLCAGMPIHGASQDRRPAGLEPPVGKNGARP